MPHPWALVDSSFPTFTGDESPHEQIGQLVEYMMLLTEALKYQLENLDNSNWNGTALKNLQTDTTKDVVKENEILAAHLTRVAGELSALSMHVNELQKQNRTEFNELGKAQKQTQKELTRLQKGVQSDDDGNATLGGDGKNVYLVGNVYINGVLYE